MTVEISVVVPSHNRRDSVLRLLRALEAGTVGPDRFELIVVADGCSDDTVAVLREKRPPFLFQVLAQDPGRGAGAARNAGAAVAQGPILLFVDDDIEPLPGMLQEHLARHRDGGAGPLVVVGAPIPVRGSLADFHHVAVWSWWEQQFERMRQPGYRFSYSDIFSGVLSLPAAVFRTAGGFDTTLPRSCRDDWELGLRLLRMRARIVFSRPAGGYHHEMRVHARLAERKEAEGRADIELARLHPDLRAELQLAGPFPRRRSLAGLLRRLAFRAPTLGRSLIAGLTLLLGPLEWVRLRGSWRRVHGAAMYFAYWDGVAAALGGGDRARAALESLVRAPSTGLPPAPPRMVDLELGNGLRQAEEVLDREAPEGARVLLGGREVGWLQPRPGTEVLRGHHLREQLASVLCWELSFSLALVRARQSSNSWEVLRR